MEITTDQPREGSKHPVGKHHGNTTPTVFTAQVVGLWESWVCEDTALAYDFYKLYCSSILIYVIFQDNYGLLSRLLINSCIPFQKWSKQNVLAFDEYVGRTRPVLGQNPSSSALHDPWKHFGCCRPDQTRKEVVGIHCLTPGSTEKWEPSYPVRGLRA